MQNRITTYLAAIIAALGGLLFGFNTGVISGAILFISNRFQLSATMNGVVVGSVLFGAFFGAALSGRFADILGRKKLLIITALIFIIGTTLSITANSLNGLIISRVIVGVAIGLSSFVAPLYITEIATTKYRGALVCIYQLLIAIGICCSYLVDYYSAAGKNWHFMLGIGIIPAICLFIGMLFMPESPRWMVAHGWTNKARKILKRLRSRTDVEAELAAIESKVSQHANWRMLFKPWTVPAIIVGFGLVTIQQATGINTIIYYAPTLLKMIGIQSAALAILASVGVGLINIVFTFAAIFLIDRIGRRPLLLIGLTFMAIATTTVATSFAFKIQTPSLDKIVISSMIVYVIGFAIGLGPITWLMVSEVFPLKIRGLATSLAVAFHWIANMIVIVAFLPMLQLLGYTSTFLMFSLICIASWVFIYRFIPETKNISLEQIETNLREGRTSRNLGR